MARRHPTLRPQRRANRIPSTGADSASAARRFPVRRVLPPTPRTPYSTTSMPCSKRRLGSPASPAGSTRGSASSTQTRPHATRLRSTSWRRCGQQVDAYLLDLLAMRTFSSKDFAETRKGVCRVLAPLSHTLAETCGQWAKAIAPVVENVAATLAAKTRIAAPPTPLTQSRRSAGRNAHRCKPKTAARPLRVRAGSCASCGAPLASDRVYCDECLPEHEQQKLALFCEAGPAVLARLRAEGRDPTKTEEAKKKVGQANSQRMNEAARWDAEHVAPDEAEFTNDILPALQGVPLSKMMLATGLSLRYCSQIRRGRVPHPMHWSAFKALGHRSEVVAEKDAWSKRRSKHPVAARHRLTASSSSQTSLPTPPLGERQRTLD